MIVAFELIQQKKAPSNGSQKLRTIRRCLRLASLASRTARRPSLSWQRSLPIR